MLERKRKYKMNEAKENETCEASLGPSDAGIVEQPKSSSMEVEGESKMKEDRKGEEKETEKPEAKNGEEQVAANDKIEEKDAIKYDHSKSIGEKLDGDKPDGCSPLEQSAVKNEGIHEENSCDKPFSSEVSKMELQEEVPVNGNDKSNVGTSSQEEANKVKPADENDVNSLPKDPVPDPSVDNGMDVDKNIPTKVGGDSFEKESNGARDESFESQKIVDNGSVSQKSAGADACNARPSVLNPKSVKEEIKSVDTAKEVPMVTDSAEPNHTVMFDMETSVGGESGTEEEQSSFMKELENFFKEKSLEFKPPKFYGEPVNLLKLWRAVIQLGGYDKVTTSKLWRQVGESFRPPKTCTTVSWTFRIFYEKALLDYEKHRFHGGELILHAAQPDPGCTGSPAGNTQTPGSGRQRRDAAARAMQGWHSQRLLSNGEVGDPIIKDKSSIPSKNREKQLKSIGVQKRKRPLVGETMDKAAVHPKVIKTQSDNNVTIIDMGPPADWVKINVKTTKDCYEVYALVPGLLREEVRVQTDPAGRLVITGEPEHVDNPWGVTPFKKIVSLPSRIDPHQTSAVVTLHGQLFVRVPFEQSD